jgi:CBS domain-containing protein
MTATGSYLIPSFQHARVADAMRPGVIGCPPDSSMRDVARIMTTGAEDQNAGSCASEVLVTIAPDERLEVACELMRAHGVSHVMVVDPERNQPLGVVSTLDVAGIVAWGRA